VRDTFANSIAYSLANPIAYSLANPIAYGLANSIAYSLANSIAYGLANDQVLVANRGTRCLGQERQGWQLCRQDWQHRKDWGHRHVCGQGARSPRSRFQVGVKLDPPPPPPPKAVPRQSRMFI
jgi:hypothetical protein